MQKVRNKGLIFCAICDTIYHIGLHRRERGKKGCMMKKKQLEEKENEVYRYICDYSEENGYPPSVRDIQSALGIKSTATVHSYLTKLEMKGYIVKEQGKSRTLRVGSDITGGTPSVRVPVVGQVAAGLPILAQENYDGYIEFSPPHGMQRGELFALKIKGESMIEAGILDGDYVVVSRTSYVENGDIAVVLIDDEATIKTFYRENGRFRLQPQNRTMKPIITDEVYILGKVVAALRYYR